MANDPKGAPPRQPEGGRLDRTALDRLPLHPGLCATCRHLRLHASRRSAFARCALADADPAFPRYPRLPVTACRGYAPIAREETERAGGEVDTGNDEGEG
jgi:hypothetical protein